MKRHAYCILAHNDYYCLQQLILCLDDERNDIFIHIDKKSVRNGLVLKTNYSRISILPMEYSEDIRWGAFSLVKAEISILAYARSQGNYTYYHLLSGQDLPIKSQNYIHTFFDSIPIGSNLVGFKDFAKKDRQNVLKRVVPIHFFINSLRHKNQYLRFIFRSFEDIASNIQRILRLKISHEVEYRKGCNWISITEEFTDYILSKKDYVNKILGKSILCDELFVQTLIWNSEFKSTIYDYSDEYTGCMRFIDWERGKPYIWLTSDFETLSKSNKLFARKFSSAIDKNIIDMISTYVRH